MKFVTEIFKVTWNCVRASPIRFRLCSEICEHSLGVSTCLTSPQNRLTSIRILSCILLPCSSFQFRRQCLIYSL